MVSPSFSRAAAPRDELLRLVPDAVGFCVVVQDLRAHAAVLHASPFAEQVGRSPLAVTIRNSASLKKLDCIESKMKEKLGLDWKRLRDDILGDAVVLAYRPGPPGKPEQEQGVLLVRARNEKVLAELIERVNRVQKEEGELKALEERRHHGIVYHRRLEYDKRAERDKAPTFYYVHGPILALSTRENMLRQVIDCDRRASTHDGRDAGPTGDHDRRDAGPSGEATRRLHELDAERALLAVWINPRAFDAELQAKIANTPAERSATVQHFARYWKALDSVVLSLSPTERELQLSLGVRVRVAELQAAARRLFREGAAASAVWRRFPESALLAVGGRLDGAALLDVLGGFLTTANWQSLHATLNRPFATLLAEEDFTGDLLPALGPDWGLCVTAPAAADKNGIPQTLFALRVDANRAKKTLDRTLLDGLDFAARLVVLSHNNRHPEARLALKTAAVDGREIHYLAGEGSLPAGLQPSWCLLHGYLLLSSSLECLTRFAQTTPAVAASGPSVPLLRISGKEWRRYLREHRHPIVRFLAAKNNVRRDAIADKLDGLLAALQFVDRIELRQRASAGQAVFTLAVQTTRALKK